MLYHPRCRYGSHTAAFETYPYYISEPVGEGEVVTVV